MSAAVFNGAYNQTTGVWTVGDLTVNQTAHLNLTGTVKTTGSYNDTATRTASTPTDPNATNDTATVTVTPVTTADVQMSVTVDNATPTIGRNVTFTIAGAERRTLAWHQGIVVQDLLPTGYTFVSKVVFNGSYDETTGVWTVGTLAANQTAQLRVTGTVKATGSYNDTATKTASAPTDPNTANDTATVTVTPITTADVQMSVSVDNATPTIGGNVTFTLLALNAGPGVASGIVVQDLLPTGYTFVSKVVFNGSYDETTGVWTVGTLAANQTAQLRVTGTVKATGSYNDTATKTASAPTDPNTANDTATVTVTPITTADVQMSVSVDNATPTIGGNVTFTLLALNAGPGVASGIVVQDLLPTGYTFVSKVVFNGSYDETTGVWTVGTLAANQTAQLRVTGTVKATGSYNDTATKTASAPTDPNTANDTATVTVTPITTADVQMSVSVDNATPTIGGNVTFTLLALNAGPGVASGIVVQDLLPTGYTFVSKVVFNGSYDETTGVWTVGTLAATQTAQLRVTGTVKATGSYNDTATKTASAPTDPNTANDTATVTVTPITTADVQMSVSVDNATPTIGGNVTFTLLALNAGPGVASGIVVQDLLPTGYTFVSKVVFNGSYDETTGVWTVGTLAATQTAQLRVTGTVKATGSYNDTATKTASAPTDPNTANDTATVTVTPH